MYAQETILLLLLAIPLLYFLPAMDAHWRGHSKRDAITLLNLLAGWTFVGWVAAAVWSATEPPREPRRRGIFLPGLLSIAALYLAGFAVLTWVGYRAQTAAAQEAALARQASSLPAGTAKAPSDVQKAKSRPAPVKKDSAERAGWVERVIDGDTFVMNNGERIRILEIDAPELNQPGGPEAKMFLTLLIEVRGVNLERKGKDRYGRTLARVLLQDGRDVGALLLEAQMAVPYKP